MLWTNVALALEGLSIDAQNVLKKVVLKIRVCFNISSQNIF